MFSSGSDAKVSKYQAYGKRGESQKRTDTFARYVEYTKIQKIFYKQATRNCPHCFVTKKTRLNNLDMSAKNTRTLAQTNMLIKYIKEGKSDKDRKSRATRFGLRPLESPLGNTVDIGLRSPPCVGHLMKYGLMRKYTKAIWYWLSPVKRIELDARIKAFIYPRDMAVITWDVSKSLGTNIQMKLYRKLMFLWPMMISDMFDHRKRIWRGFILLCQVDYLIYTYWQHRNMPLLKSKCNRLIIVLKKLKKKPFKKDLNKTIQDKQMGDKTKSKKKKSNFPNFNTPNLHQLIELVNRFLPLYENIGFFDTTFFESCHAKPKALVRSTQKSANRPNDVMRCIARNDALICAFQGMRHGPKGGYKLGSYWRHLRHPKNPDVPHPVVTRITKYASSKTSDRKVNCIRVACGDWESSSQLTPKTARLTNYKIIHDYIRRRLTHQDYSIGIREPAKFINSRYCIEKSLAIDDDICFNNIAFGRISHTIEALVTTKTNVYQFLLLVLLNYNVKIVPGAFSSKFLQNNFSYSRVIPMNIFTERCIVAHACNSQSSIHKCKMQGKEFVHNYSNNNYQVRTESEGLFFDKQVLTANWFDKSQELPVNVLDKGKKYVPKSGKLRSVGLRQFAVILIQDSHIGVGKVIARGKRRYRIHWYGDERCPTKLLVQYQPLSKKGQAWVQDIETDCDVIASGFELIDGTLPSEVFMLMDWDSRTNWNYEADCFINDDEVDVEESDIETDVEESDTETEDVTDVEYEELSDYDSDNSSDYHSDN